jgi:XTP/dITP diphosphohydrolase
MARRFSGGRLVIASHNPGKLKEIADLLAPFAVDCLSAAGLGLA